MSFHGDCNMTQAKKNRYSDEEKWSAFCLPLQEWMASNEDSDDEDILDQIATANQQLNMLLLMKMSMQIERLKKT